MPKILKRVGKFKKQKNRNYENNKVRKRTI